MICYECGHRIKGDFAKFCDHCGSSLEIKPKIPISKLEFKDNIKIEIERATTLFALWNTCITATIIFYIIHRYTDSYIYLFLLILFMLILSWILLLIKLYDLLLRQHGSMKEFLLISLCIPILGTFYFF